MNNKIYIAAAGSGKTSLLLQQVQDELKLNVNPDKDISIVTFTVNNQENIKKSIISEMKMIPKTLKVMGWYKFILDYWIKPFKGDVIPLLYDHHIGLYKIDGQSGINRVNGRYIRLFSKDGNPEKYFMTDSRKIYSDKLSEFAYECYNRNKELLIMRLSNIFSSIYIDEVQDLAGWDLEIIKIIAKSQKVNLRMYGDPRQNTLKTNFSSKNKRYNGKLDDYIKEHINTRRKTFVEIDKQTLSYSHRCVDPICDFANRLVSDYPPSHACHCLDCVKERNDYSHPKGMFVIRESDLESYIKTYNPISLIWNKTSLDKVRTKVHYNYAESKGLQTNASLIYLTKKFIDNISSNRHFPVSKNTLMKLYVAVTRAKFACALVVPDNFDNSLIGLPFWQP